MSSVYTDLQVGCKVFWAAGNIGGTVLDVHYRNQDPLASEEADEELDGVVTSFPEWMPNARIVPREEYGVRIWWSSGHTGYFSKRAAKLELTVVEDAANA